ncbi:MAG: hypothetical protein J1F35_05595 [Erysipelotrichales bacterium]|nr:hypothetical protein [Erysipelotrichales bacterium]
MSLVNKFKKILFDDIDEETEELPERSPKSKRVEEKKETTGFIEYHSDEEDTITELKLPTEDIAEASKTYETNQDDYLEVEETEENIHSAFNDFGMDFMGDDPEEIKLVKDVSSYNVNHEERRVERELRDYRKMLSNEEEDAVHEKKPFVNTPVISPVWGILDKNYKPEEIVDRTEALTKLNTGAAPRSFGPVSYNDQPLVQRKSKAKEEMETLSLKEELIELNTTISDLINDTVNPSIEENFDTQDIDMSEEVEDEPQHSLEDVVIQTDNYDNYEDIATDYEDGIEKSETVNNNIEDAFESTSEFDSINESDAMVEEETVEEEEELVDLETIVNKQPDDEDDSGLDNTIETDLFNLIDSMYKDNEDE